MKAPTRLLVACLASSLLAFSTGCTTVEQRVSIGDVSASATAPAVQPENRASHPKEAIAPEVCKEYSGLDREVLRTQEQYWKEKIAEKDARIAALEQENALLAKKAEALSNYVREQDALAKEVGADLDRLNRMLDKMIAATAGDTNTQGENAVKIMPVPPGDVAVVSEVTLAKRFVLDDHTFSLWLYWTRQDTTYKSAFPWTKFWSEASRLSKVPMTDAAWKKLAKGTIVTVPSGEIRVSIPEGVTPPAAIAVVPANDGTGQYVLDPSRAVSVKSGESVPVAEEKTPVERVVVTADSAALEGLVKEVAGLKMALTLLVIIAIVLLGLLIWALEKVSDLKHELRHAREVRTEECREFVLGDPGTTPTNDEPKKD